MHDIIESIINFTQTANQNHIDSQYMLGAIFSHNQNLIKKSIYFLKKAADSNHPLAQYKLGMIYYEVEKDIMVANRYLKLAASSNFADVYYILSIIYSNGKYIEKNKTIALICLTNAANLNHQEAKKKLDKINESLFNEDLGWLILDFRYR